MKTTLASVLVAGAAFLFDPPAASPAVAAGPGSAPGAVIAHRPVSPGVLELAQADTVRPAPASAAGPARLPAAAAAGPGTARTLRLRRDGHWLVIEGAHLPGGEIRINYLEAYCRAGSTDADWVKHTVIRHENRVIAIEPDGTSIRLRDNLADGLVVDHLIRAGKDEVTFELTAHNPTPSRSEAHWAQPCVRLGTFTGYEPRQGTGDIDDYLPKCFVFLGGKLTRMPTPVWEKRARYVPGQVWAGPGVPRTDVNPRPLSSQTPSNGLIGCFSADETLIFATAWDPYQELFQGVARCLHSDFRLGGIGPGNTLRIRGKIYIMPNDVEALLARYRQDFPERRIDSP